MNTARPETPLTSQAAERIRTADPFITREIEVPPSAPNPHEKGGSGRLGVTRTAGKDTPVDSKPTLRGITVRMSMDLTGAEWFAQNSSRLPDDVRQRVQDQLWLRAVLFQQRKRVDRVERDAYDRRADSILAALDPAEQEAT